MKVRNSTAWTAHSAKNGRALMDVVLLRNRRCCCFALRTDTAEQSCESNVDREGIMVVEGYLCAVAHIQSSSLCRGGPHGCNIFSVSSNLTRALHSPSARAWYESRGGCPTIEELVSRS